ncbi:MAG: response regulator [Candidatus Methanoperedens sp.]|nr:response regulator [Candidatus Methanoperedens sp.]
MEKLRILVVDDEPVNVELLDGILSTDYEIMKAFNGNEALKQVEKSLPDLILLDIIMQGMSGYEVCRKLKNNEKTISIPIILISNLKDKSDRIKAIQAGADEFLSKPFDMDILCERMKSLLKVKHYYDNLRLLDTSGQIFSINKVNNSLDHFDVSFCNNVACREEIVKSHLEIILLKFLSEKPMCGLEIIKEINKKYNVLLSQGTVYTTLYKLKKDGIIYAEFEKGNMRTKKYSATGEGKITIYKKINEFVNLEMNILNSIQVQTSSASL